MRTDQGTGSVEQGVAADDGTRSLEQEVAAGQSEKTPVALLSSVVGIIACLFAFALALAVIAYVLA
jgi:hypothetical protein